MGYRSDVAYTIRFEKEEDYRLFILEAKANGLESCFSDDGAIWDEAECDDERRRIDFCAAGVKWYESYPDVQRHEKLLSQARDWVDNDNHVSVSSETSRFRIGFAFVRVGEDAQDIHEEHDGLGQYDWLYVERSIQRN